MNLRNGYIQYREQSVMTASPGDLVLMLYDGCLRQMRLARLALTPSGDEKPAIEEAGLALKKAQDIIIELINGLDFQYDIARQLFRIYEYVDHQLIQANIRKDSKLVESLEEIMTEMRNTWEQAIKISRSNLAVGE